MDKECMKLKPFYEATSKFEGQDVPVLPLIWPTITQLKSPCVPLLQDLDDDECRQCFSDLQSLLAKHFNFEKEIAEPLIFTTILHPRYAHLGFLPEE